MDTKMTSNLEELEKLFNSRMNCYEDKLEQLAGGTSTSHPDLSSLLREFTEFKSFILKALALLKAQVEYLSLGYDRHETQMRKKVLLIHGVPENPQEKLLDKVSSILSDQLKITDITEENIHVCHRLGASRGKARPILVRFHDMMHRQAVWDYKTALKNTGITISEFLTKSRHSVFIAARKYYGVKQTWTVEGKIMVLLPNKIRRKIETMSELQSLISQFPVDSSSASGESVPSQEQSSPKSSSSKLNTKRKNRRR